MAKGKSVNPADAYRKAQRKKELKKNKADRSKKRDFALVKKDTFDLEDEIANLEALPTPSSSEKARLTEVKAELEKINQKKEEYVKEHPEHRRLVYRPRRQHTDSDKPEEELVLPTRNLFKANGLPRHPERSIYYDPVMNPFGVAPPGMPYRERDLLPGEIDSEAENSEDDDDVIMPEGPPPKPEDAVDSDDDIPMPEGPPPGQELPEQGTSDEVPVNPPLPPMPPPPMLLNNFGPSTPFPPFPPTGFPAYMAPPPGVPPPPPNFAMPPPPPGFFPRRQQSTAALQDPLSSIPHQTFQGHRAQVLAPPHPSLPPKPRPEASQSAIVSAEPQLRDLKKEATSFVPTSLKRKKVASASASGRINAAPGVGDVEGEVSARPDLLSALKGQFGLAPTINPPAPPSSKGKSAATKTKDDYEKFVEEMGGILGP